MKNHYKLIDKFVETLEFEDRLDGYNEDVIRQLLSDYVEIYQDIHSISEEEFSKELGEPKLLTKKEFLKNLESAYNSQLNILKKMGSDTSGFPSNLDDLVK